MKKLSSVISVGYGRQLFVADNPERQRMERCAAELESLHMIVFTHRRDGLQQVHGAAGLVLHPTNSLSRWLMIWDAVWIGRRLVREVVAAAQPLPHITTQDPFEAGLVGYVLKRLFGVQLTIQEHGDVFSTTFWQRESIGNRVRVRVGRWLLRRADVVRVVAKRMIPTMRQLGVTVPIRQLPVAVEVGRFAAQAKPAPRPETVFTYLSVARFVPQKKPYAARTRLCRSVSYEP